MAQDPLALPPASANVTTTITATSTSVPGTPQEPAHAPAPTKDFKKIVLRQTARKFTARPPPPRRPWPKPNYYCDYDSHESITSSLFSSDVVFSKSVVESLFFNTRYNKDSNTSPPTGPVQGPNAVRVTTLKYGQRKNVTQVDDDIQFIAHIKPNSQSDSQSQSHLNGLSPPATNGHAKGIKRVKPTPKSKSSIKNDKSKESKDPLSLHQTNTDTPKSSKAINSGSKVKTSISLVKVPPKKKQRLTLSNKKPVINGLGPEPGPAKEKAIVVGRKSAPPALLPPQPQEPEVDAGQRPSTSFPTHLWSLPTLAWTQATNSPTASSSKSQSPSAPVPVSAANSVTPTRIAINGQPAAKKRALPSPSTPQIKQESFRSKSSTKKKQIKVNGAQIRLVKQSPKRAIDARLACPSLILEATQAKILIPIVESKIKKVNTNGSGSATKIVKNGVNINSLLRAVEESTKHNLVKQNDKNNNTCGPLISKTKPDEVQGVPVLNKRISGHSGVQTPKQTKINGMFKLAKKNPNASTTNQKSKAPSHSIVRNQGHTLSNGPRPKAQELNSNGASRDEIKTDPAHSTTKLKSPITANSTIPSPPCNIKVVPKSPRTSPAKPKSHLPEFEDTCILVVPRPMTNEAPIDYSLKKMPPKDPSPDTVSLAEPLNLVSTRQLRTTPTKSYAHLTKRSCPCDCSAPH